MKRLSLSVFAAILAFTWLRAEAPAGYYTTCEGKSGKALLQALYQVMGAHTNVGYDGLWEVYKTSDVRSDGTVWDIYSTKHWIVGKEHCGNYKNVGDCINREHSMPKSWFNGASPMYSDAFHLYPTDGKVNGQRSNFPYGECSGGTNLGTYNGYKALGRLGRCTFAGYSGTVFEPDDEFKGDLARSYFYMAACYNDRISNWTSDMLAGNNYPAFSTWAVNLLLKWHRQDPVSDKETRRNDAVYAHQHNRNPFIDHPEMVEYIWGNMQSEGWEPDGAVAAVMTSPADGSTVDVGMTAPGTSRSVIVPVRGTGLADDVTVTVSGTGYSCNVSTLQAALVNDARAGATITFETGHTGTYTGRLTLRSGDITASVNLTAQCVNGIPAAPATDITETSFTARWYNVDGDGATYSLMLYLNDDPMPGYPVSVEAETEAYTVTGLESGAEYAYTLSNGIATSDRIRVTTAVPMPSIQFMFDGELTFSTVPGEPSDIAELLLDIDNIAGDITVTVSVPFELSTDKAMWSTAVTLAEGEDRLYMRLNGDTEGVYTTGLTATAGTYVNDDIDVTGVIASPTGPFVEDFETEFTNSYTGGTMHGSACEWKTNNAGVWEQDKSLAYAGRGVCRYGKNTDSWIATATPKAGGLSTVTFMARPWSGDPDATLKVQYSTDGVNWNTAGTVTLTGSNYSPYSVTVNRPGDLYLRLQQGSGSRLLIDDITAADYTGGVGAVSELQYHSWDAYCRDSRLVIENSTDGAGFTVYGIDGIVRLDAPLPAGRSVMTLSPGLYIVASGDFTRRVLIK